MRVFVTGGAGFIGSHLSRHLAGEGHRITVFDNLSNSSKDTISGIRGLEFVRGDITDSAAVARACSGHDMAIHLAAQISVQRSMEHPEETARVNVDGTSNVIEACSRENTGIIAASSAAVFGNSRGVGDTLDEESACKPLSPYGSSKLEMEGLLKRYGTSVMLRFFNVYGPGQTPEYAGVITKFAGFIRGGSDVVIYGDGEQTRDFISIDDTVVAIKHAMSRMGLKPDTYNIGTGISTSINDLAGMMLEIGGSDNRIVHADPKAGDIKFVQTSVARAREHLGFECEVPLADGIRKYWDHL